ncbi:hypothetical protein M758_9G003900 [Ceratodon purpureus]|nr:hypothetical protein M758_9G003900 [Ceratodon purpureus]
MSQAAMASVASMLACVVSVVLLLSTSSRAFDTGAHSDLTRNSLNLYGYSRDAQHMGAFSNWLTDLYAFSPSMVAGLDVVPDYVAELETFHCNNLYSIVFGANYMARFTLNTIDAVKDAVRRGAVLDYLAILGTSLHVYQDFYAHSNWASIKSRSRCDCYEMTSTFFDSLTRANGSVEAMVTLEPEYLGFITYSYGGRGYPHYNIFSANVEHGGYCEGTNSDSYVRPKFESTYSYAFAGSMEWIYNYERWAADASFVARAKSWTAGNFTAELYRDFNASFEVSYASTQLYFGESDGHWKGPGSGDTSTFAVSTARLSTDNQDPYQQLYLRNATPPVWSLLATPPLYSFLNTSTNSDGDVVADTASLRSTVGNFTSFRSLPGNYTNLTAVVVRTTSYNLSDDYTKLIGGKPSPWALISIDGLEFMDAPMQDTQTWTPFWTAIKFVPIQSSAVQIQYQLVTTADSTNWGKTVPIAPGDGILNVTFNTRTNTLSGDATGVHDTFATALSSSANGSQVTIYVDSRPLTCASAPNATGVVTFCDNTAYGELGSFPTCEASTLPPLGQSGGSSTRWLWTHSLLCACIYLLFIHV